MPDNSIRILHLDDNPVDAELVALALNAGHSKLPAVVNYVRTREEYLAALERKEFDLILSDYRMGAYDGDQALAAARERCPEVPFIMVTGELSEELVIETLKRGATDYVLKDRIFRLVPAIQRALIEAENEKRRLAAEHSLQESEERFRAAVDNVPYAYLLYDAGLHIRFVNKAGIARSGLSMDKIIGHRDEELFCREVTDSYLPYLKRCLETKEAQILESTHTLPGVGTTASIVHYIPLLDKEGSVRQILGITYDITERKHAEDDLQKAHQHLERQNRELEAERVKWQRLLEGIADEVWACDALGKVSMVNLATQRNLGLMDFERHSLVETLKEIDVYYPDGSLRPDKESPLRRSLQGDVLRGEEIVRNRRTGTSRIRQYSSAPVGDAEGKIVGSVAVIRDVTEERQAEAEIRKLNEDLEERVRQRTAALERVNKELESFSYSVSHDLKAPLRLITGFAALMGRQAESNLTPKQLEYLTTIQEQAGRMDELIRALLEFSRITRKEPTLMPVDTRRLVEEAIREQRQLLDEEAGQRVQVKIADLPVVRADAVLLRMVFTNLLSNAFKFTRTVREPTISVDAVRKNGFFHFRVADNGVGFPKAQTEKLFKVFQRLHGTGEFEGSGIGLANVRKIIERHGGTVCGEGEEGKGATFYFTLPADESVDTTG